MKTIRDLIEREEIGDTYKVGEERIEFQTKIAIEEVNSYYNQLFERFNHHKN